ncbi:hypothetical protein SNEBB_004185 [Seison nebaliae]|nr:hypothetical protein SNEBB_004185 [Seison nebaliae]
MLRIINNRQLFRHRHKIVEVLKRKEEAVKIFHGMTVKEMSEVLKKNVSHVYECLEYSGIRRQSVGINEKIENFDLLIDIVKKSGRKYEITKSPQIKKTELIDKNVYPRSIPIDTSHWMRRRPVICIVGHVDHGKTTLLDSLRHSHVVDEEFGGITQHIGAFSIDLDSDKKHEIITCLDTPGHAAFSSMRQRGVNVTDIVILVVSAIDGVKPQTLECIELIKRTNTPTVVAINKCDLPQANIKKTKKQLLENGLILEDFGGDIQNVSISALTGSGITDLISTIITEAELHELRGDPSGKCEGIIIESSIDQHRGKLATILVQRGNLKRGAAIVAGNGGFGKVRNIFDETGKVLTSKLSVGEIAQVIGWKELPEPGDLFLEVESEKKMHEVMNYRHQLEHGTSNTEHIDLHAKEYQKKLEMRRKIGWREFRYQERLRQKTKGARPKKTIYDDELKEKQLPKLSIVLKCDVDGTMEALMDIFQLHESTHCHLDVVHFGLGDVSVKDVELANAFNGIVYAFNVSTSKDTKLVKKRNIKKFDIIYKLLDDMKEEMISLIPDVEVVNVIGEGEVSNLFYVKEDKKQICVGGTRCLKGQLVRKKKFRILRMNYEINEKEIIFEGKIHSMKHFKNDISLVEKGSECGISLIPFDMEKTDEKEHLQNSTFIFQSGDRIECFEQVKKKGEFVDYWSNMTTKDVEEH